MTSYMHLLIFSSVGIYRIESDILVDVNACQVLYRGERIFLLGKKEKTKGVPVGKQQKVTWDVIGRKI